MQLTQQQIIRKPKKLSHIYAALVCLLLGAVTYFAAPYVKAAGGITQAGCTGVCLTPDALNQPRSVVVDSADNIYVLQRADFSTPIIKFNQAGDVVNAMGSYGTGDGELSNGPYGMTIDASDHLYIADTNNHRIQKFDSSGNFIAKWGNQGSGDGELSYPSGVAVDGLGNVYVADSGNRRIQKFDSSGNFLTKWGEYGSGNGQFSYPYGMTIDASNNVYVSDTGRVQKFDSDGNYLAQWGEYGSGDGQFNGSYFGLNYDDAIYVADEGNARVQKFDTSGIYQSQFGAYGTDPGQFRRPIDVATDSSGNIYVADNQAGVQKFDSAGVYIRSYGVSAGDLVQNGAQDGSLIQVAAGVASDAQGNYYVTELQGNQIKKYDVSNNKLTTWGSYGSGDGEFSQPFGIAVDASDNVYIADSNNSRIQKFDSSGSFIGKWGSEGTGDGEFIQPFGIANDLSNNVYVLDSGNSRIQKFDGSGNFVAKWGSYGSGDGEFSQPFGIAVDASNNVYVADTGNSRIQKFTSEGAYISQWAIDPNHGFPAGVTVDAEDNVYVTETQFEGTPKSQVEKFDTEGNAIASYESSDITGTPLVYGYGLAANKARPGLLHATAYLAVLHLCDHDVSDNNCTGPSGGGSGQTLTYPDPVKGSTVTLVLPSDVTSPTVGAVNYGSLPKDGGYSYPAGLTTFQFTTTPGATKTVTLYYDLPGNPSDYTARKYKTNTQTYLDIPGATITREDYNGKSMLKLTYNITDGGILDQDGAANGTVIDPVGLATTNLADTGENTTSYLIAILTLLTVGLGLATAYHKRHTV